MKAPILTLLNLAFLLGFWTFRGQAQDSGYDCILVTTIPQVTQVSASPTLTLAPSPTLIPTFTPRTTQTPSRTPTATTVKLITPTPSSTPLVSFTPTLDVANHPVLQTATRLAIARQTELAKGDLWPLITPTNEEFGPFVTQVSMKTYIVTYREGMNLRADHTVNSAQVGYLSYGQKIGIIEEVSDGGYMWGRGTVGAQPVWVALRMMSGFKYLEEVKP